MAEKGLEGIDETVHQTYSWLNEIAGELGADRHGALNSLRAVLHAVRDRLSIDESAQLAAQLPMLVRGMYYEGWDPGRTANGRDLDLFLAQVGREAHFERADAEWASHAVGLVLSKHVSHGEMEDVLRSLPKPTRELLQ